MTVGWDLAQVWKFDKIYDTVEHNGTFVVKE